MVYNSRCLEKCPSQLFIVDSPDVVGQKTCSECSSSQFFQVLEGRKFCLDQCPKHTYTRPGFRECLKCHSSCETCTGQTEFDCTRCKPGLHQFFNPSYYQAQLAFTSAEKRYNGVLTNPPKTFSCITNDCSLKGDFTLVEESQICIPTCSKNCQTCVNNS